MKASQLEGTHFFKGLIYGDAGTGKTCLAAEFATLGPVEYWDFDNKFSSAVRWITSSGKQSLLNDIDVWQFGKLQVKERIPAWEARSRLIDDAVAKKQPLHFKTLVLDSLTMFSHYIMEDYVFRSQLGIKRSGNQYSQQDYGLFGSHMTRILTGLLSLDVNVVVLGHIDESKDENSGIVKRQPHVPGQRVATMLPAWFEEVYAARVTKDGKRILQTQPGGGYVCRGQRGLAAEVEMSVKALLA